MDDLTQNPNIRKKYSVVGVKFNNDEVDGGESRQEVIRKLAETGYPMISITLVHTTFNGALAIKCVDTRTNQVVGFVAKTDIPELQNVTTLTATINYYKETYGIVMYPQIPPTNKQYMFVKELC